MLGYLRILAVLASLLGSVLGTPVGLITRQEGLLQDIVTWDQFSLKINNTRLFIFCGEFHPFRLPVPDLWLDIFQKIKAVGFNTVSFYAYWALLEGKQGDFSAEGVFDFVPFFDAAKQAGIYLIARPGPYINAEATGGGFPGWLNRIPGYVRLPNPYYLEAVHSYESKIGPIVADAQITRGGSVILLQPENEYSYPGVSHSYMADVERWYRDAGIVIPTVFNDGYAYGNFASGTGPGAVDIYGSDSYPLGFDCSQPYVWSGLKYQYFPGLTPPPNTPNDSVAIDPRWNVLHEIISPKTPNFIAEFQGGSFDGWGGAGFEACATFTNAHFERVFYKNAYSFGLKGISYYMVYGGTNWGNMGFPYGYTSYDYGSAIKEDRTLMREKYSELKLQANFFKVSPAWLMADAQDFTNKSQIADTDAITVTALTTNSTSFYVIRHSDYTSSETTQYHLRLSTSLGNVTIPQLGGPLSLNGRDSKIMSTDYMAGSSHVIYTTAEIFTWEEYSDKTVLLLYAGPDETNEVAFKMTDEIRLVEGELEKIQAIGGMLVVQWKTRSQRTMFKINELEVYMLDRYSAYDYWVVPLDSAPEAQQGQLASLIVKAGYLIRNATIDGDTLRLFGDTNTTTTIEIIGTPRKISKVTWNGNFLSCQEERAITCNVSYSAPKFSLPKLADLDWRYTDGLPEIQSSYDDSPWTLLNHSYTNDTQSRNLTTPTSLYCSDYGFHAGTLLFRTHFISDGKETQFNLETKGGSAFGASVWVNDTFLGSWDGAPQNLSAYQNLSMPQLMTGEHYAITVLLDMMGYEESGPIGANASSKSPRGILNYELTGHEASEFEWKMTGNLGGEDYIDRTRGPLNEGGLYAERQGWHQPRPPINSSVFSPGSPMKGISKPGVAFYTASFILDMPKGWDIPLAFTFANTTTQAPVPYRAQLYVNGYQFGKYINHLGPQTSFPVPEGILNYHGENWVALTLWALGEGGAKLEGLVLEATAVIQTGYGTVGLSPMPAWMMREGAY